MSAKTTLAARVLSPRNESLQGQTLVEYAMILAFISVIAIAVMISLGRQADATKITVTQQLVIAQSSH